MLSGDAAGLFGVAIMSEVDCSSVRRRCARVGQSVALDCRLKSAGQHKEGGHGDSFIRLSSTRACKIVMEQITALRYMICDSKCREIIFI